MAKSTSNSAKRILWDKECKENIYIKYFIFRYSRLQTKPFDITLFKGRQFYILDFVYYFCNQPCKCCIVFHHGKMKQIIEVLKWFWCSKVARGVFLLIIIIIIWNNIYCLTGTGGIWYNLFNSFLSSLLSSIYQVSIYFTIRCCQIIIKGNKIFNSDFIVFTKLSKEPLKFFIYFIIIGNAVDRLLSKYTFLEAVNYCFCTYISASNL